MQKNCEGKAGIQDRLSKNNANVQRYCLPGMRSWLLTMESGCGKVTSVSKAVYVVMLAPKCLNSIRFPFKSKRKKFELWNSYLKRSFNRMVDHGESNIIVVGDVSFNSVSSAVSRLSRRVWKLTFFADLETMIET